MLPPSFSTASLRARIFQTIIPTGKRKHRMSEHELKTWPDHYDNIAIGIKTFEYRKNDRDYHSGDTLILRRFDPDLYRYTGERMKKTVTHILYGAAFGIPVGYCIMSLGDHQGEAPDVIDAALIGAKAQLSGKISE
jgi:hypothetical protein